MRHFAQLTLQGNSGQPVESLAYEVTEEQVEVLEALVSKLSKVFDIALLVQTSKDNSVFTPRNDVPAEAAPEAPVAEAPVIASEELPAETLQEATSAIEEIKAQAKKKK